VYIEPPVYPWGEANLVVVNDLSDVLLDLVYHYLIDDFALMFINEIGL
jgi:hypothetical protein